MIISGIDWNMKSQIPLVMNFAVHDRPREVRMQAAYFIQQLCQSRFRLHMILMKLTVHLFVGKIF